MDKFQKDRIIGTWIRSFDVLKSSLDNLYSKIPSQKEIGIHYLNLGDLQSYLMDV